MEKRRNQSEEQLIGAQKKRKNESDIYRTKKTVEIINQNDSQINIISANAFEIRYPNFECINDDCLLYICKYLEFIDIVNLAATCSRMQNFAIDHIFPRKAKKLLIEIVPPNWVQITAPLLNSLESKVTLNTLEASLNYFHEFVEYLQISSLSDELEFEHIAATVLERCGNLTSLCISFINFTFDGTQRLHDRIERLQNLKELSFLNCTGIINNWPVSSKTTSRLDKLSVSTYDDFSINFFENFKQLSSLTVNISYTYWSADDLASICELYGNSLEHLKIIQEIHDVDDDDFGDDFDDHEEIATFINEKLLKLNRLDFKGPLTESSMFIIKLRQLKYLKINCNYQNVYSMMQALSDNRVIETLHISNGFYYEEDTIESPLIFEMLQVFELFMIVDSSSFLKKLTTSQMPKIHTFNFYGIENPAQDLRKFCESKKTLKSIGKDSICCESCSRVIALMETPTLS